MPLRTIQLATGNGTLRLDARPDRIDLRDRPYQPPLVSIPSRWPSSQDIDIATDTFRNLVMNQGQEGACTGFGLAAVINFARWKNSLYSLRRSERGIMGVDFEKARVEPVSPYQLYHLARVYDEWEGEDYEGSSCRGAVKGYHKHGVCAEKFWPAKKAPIGDDRDRWQADAASNPLGAYYRVERTSISDMQAAIYEVGAIYASANVHEGWEFAYSEDSLPVIHRKPNFDSDNDYTGAHAFAIIGYESRGFIVQNSWGLDWGFNGFAILSYSDWVESAMDAWVTAFGAPAGTLDSLETHSRDRTTRQSAVYGEAEFPAPATTDPESEESAIALCSFRSDNLSSSSNRKIRWFWNNDDSVDFSDSMRELVTEEAYGLTVVLENDGRPLRRRVGFDSIEETVEEVCRTLPSRWWKRRGNKNSRLQLMVFFHGGLNSEQDSINRIRKMAPWFLANRIYPLFLTWRTSFLDSMMGIIDDSLSQLFGSIAEQRSLGWRDTIAQQISEATDRSIEVACQKLLVKPIWTQMKQNAAAAAESGRGLAMLANCLADLKKDVGAFDLHLVGHSAGSLPIGHLLKLAKRKKVDIKSCRLLAPACTMDFANKHYGPALKNGTLDGAQFHVHLLNDKLERNDRVGPYGKSLLYLVSRALEVHHKEPLLGMEGVWRLKDSQLPADMWYVHDGENQPVNNRVNDSIETWHQKFDHFIPIENIHLAKEPEIFDGKGHILQNHGNFDNNCSLFNQVIRDINGIDPAPMVGDLSD